MIDSILMCNLIHRKTCLKHNYKHTNLVEVQDSIIQALMGSFLVSTKFTLVVLRFFNLVVPNFL